MLQYLLITHRETGVPLFERVAPEFKDISPVMLSGLMTALNNTAKLLRMGELSFFEAYNFKVILSAAGSILVTLIVDKDDHDGEWRECASTIAERFEAMFPVEDRAMDISRFSKFSKTLDEILGGLGWKIAFSGSLDHDQVLYLLVYNAEEKTIYQLGEVPAPENLVRRVRSLLEHQEVSLQDEGNVLRLIRRNHLGGVLAFRQHSQDIVQKRLSKMLAFLVENLYSRFWFNRRLEKAAASLFKQREIDAVMRMEGKPLIEILQEDPSPIEALELLRRFKIRNLLTTTSPER